MRAHIWLSVLLLANPATVGSPDIGVLAVGNVSRLRNIAVAYVGAHETARRFEEYSLKNQNLAADATTDREYYEGTFESTALDVRDAMTADRIEGVELQDVAFFRVYASTVNPPHPVYVVGVKVNGAVFRFLGFVETDFDRMMNNADVASLGVPGIVRLYYRLNIDLHPGPILDAESLRRAMRSLKDTSGSPEVKISLPESERVNGSTLLRVHVWDAESGRVEVHRVQVDRMGAVKVVEREVLRDRRKVNY